jgi:lipoprotein-anchoring transpeptidase ErfK/SrfK
VGTKEKPPETPPTPPDPEDTYSYWNEEEEGTGPLRVNIDLGEQTAYIYRGKTLIGRSRVATGRSGHGTPPGKYAILEKTRDKRSNLYGQIIDGNGNVIVSDADSRRHSAPSGGKFVGAEMPCWMRLTPRGIGMHIGPIPNPGSPASHGCIRMRQEIAEKLFEHAPVGTPVSIVQ